MELKVDIKLTLALLKAVHGRTITMGDVIAHNLQISSFGQICGVFQTLLATDFVLAVGNATSSRRTIKEMMSGKIMQKPPKLIVEDVDEMRRALARLFEVRNILCHELPSRPAYESPEISGFLKSAEAFSHAADETFRSLLFGDEPQTNVEMKIRAAENLKKTDEQLAVESERIELNMDKKRTQLWRKADRTFRAYRQAEAECRADEFRGGTISGLIWTAEEDALTQARITHLKEIYSRDED